ncbi:hypothetical protein LguiB_015838 [Lonicera macranthoides]
MEPQKLFSLCSLLFSLFLTGYNGVEGRLGQHHRGHKLFVFGDSYSDTGNDNKTEVYSWSVPYGITFPGNPTGRFSDGRVLTDFIAKFLGIKSPIPYEQRVGLAKRWRYGMNFAYGGTGVFKTDINEPNMTTQIHRFENVINSNNRSVYHKKELENCSLALVTLSGNDYSYYISNSTSTVQGLIALIPQVVSQLALNLKRIHELGVGKVAVNSLQPLGCLPRLTSVNSYTKCNDSMNALVQLHNSYLYDAVAKLNNETQDSTFIILDLYSAFNSVILNNTGIIKFETPLKPCCIGIGDGYCGVVENGTKKYTLCENPSSSFFWDLVHPTQAGWTAVFSFLLPILKQIKF